MPSKKKSNGSDPNIFITVVLVIILILIGLGIAISSADNDDTVGIVIGLALLPGSGIVAAPAAVRSARKDSKKWQEKLFKDEDGDSFRTPLLKERFFYTVTDPSPYHERLLKGVKRRAVTNAVALVVLLILAIAGCLYGLENGPSDPNLTKREADMDMAQLGLIVVFLTIFIIPIIAYNITCTIHRVRIVSERKYLAYHAVVTYVDLFEMCITSQEDTQYKREYKFSQCKCLGIRRRKVKNTEVVLFFIPDEVFLIPVDLRDLPEK